MNNLAMAQKALIKSNELSRNPVWDELYLRLASHGVIPKTDDKFEFKWGVVDDTVVIERLRLVGHDICVMVRIDPPYESLTILPEGETLPEFA